MIEAESTLTVTHVGEPRGEFPEVTHVRFITNGRPVDHDEIEAAVRAADVDTCMVVRYDSEARVGCYVVVDDDPNLVLGQVVPIPAMAPLAEEQLQHAYDAGARLRELRGTSGGDFWSAWLDYQPNGPVIEARAGTLQSYFHGGFYGHPYSPELAKHPLDRKNAG